MDGKIIPELMASERDLLLEHCARYQFAKQYCRGKVLDITCGVGYGCNILLKQNPNIERLVGIDPCQEAIDYAKGYYHFIEAEYYVDDVLSEGLSGKYGFFDAITSFKTVEFLEKPSQFINNLYTLLSPRGTLIISSKIKSTDKMIDAIKTNSFTEKEFLSLLEPFKNIQTYYQANNLITGSKENYDYILAICTK